MSTRRTHDAGADRGRGPAGLAARSRSPGTASRTCWSSAAHVQLPRSRARPLISSHDESAALVGLEPASAAGGDHVDTRRAGRRDAGRRAGTAPSSRSATRRAQGRRRSARPIPRSAPQDHLEPLLLDHLATTRLAAVRFGTE